MPRKIPALCFLSLLFFPQAPLPFERVSNYTSTLTINDFAFDGDTVWVATSGGLYCYNRATGTGVLFSNPAFFPDPRITAVCLDAEKNLWVASAAGYLTRRTADGRPTVVPSYHASGWKITDLLAREKYLIVTSDNGCSVFDTDKMVSIKSATGFAGFFLDPRVNTAAVFRSSSSRDTLLLGCQRGVAKLDITGDNLAKAIFYDPSIWSIDTSFSRPVKSFVTRGNGYIALADIGTSFNDQIITALSSGGADETAQGIVYADGEEKMRLPSLVTAIASDNAGTCCIGTLYDYFYFWNGSDTANAPVEGPVFTFADRVYVDHENSVWVCPQIGSSRSNKRQGFSVFRNGRWQLFALPDYPTMGLQISEKDIYGIVEDPDGKMWFGTWGGHVKRYTRADNFWRQYCIGAQDFGKGHFFQSPVCYKEDYGKCDAIARDSTGFLWFGIFWGWPGSVLCYDPRYEPNPNVSDPLERHFRYFFPKNDTCYSEIIGCLCVDRANNIIIGDGIVGDGGTGRILVISHTGNPLRDGVRIEAKFTSQKGTVFDAAAARDTLTYIATSTGLYTYDPMNKRLVSGLGVRVWTNGVPVFTVIDTTLEEVSTIEVEDDRFLWLGTLNNGLIRYDLATSSGIVIDETAGLLSNRINDLSIDRKNGYLWIASDRGVSRYALGYSLDRKNIGTATVWPNPFSKRRHREVVFEKLPPGSGVQVFTAGGSLVASLAPQESGAAGAACIWNPPKGIVPGIYLYTVRSRIKSSQGKIIVTP